MLFGYLSDSFGRRLMLLITLVAMLIFNVISGLVVSPAQLFLMRALVSMATGAIGTLVGTAISDFTTLEDRVKYQAYAGVGTAIGGSIGAVGGAALAFYSHWRVFYYGIQAPLTLAGLIMVANWVPSSAQLPSRQHIWAVIKTMDFIGIISLTGTVACGAVLLSQAGRTWAWGEPRVILLLVLFVLSLAAFLLAGFKNLPLVRPIIPFDIFRNVTVSMICAQQFLLGGAYWAFLFLLPIFLQFVMGYDPLEGAVFLLPFLFTHGIWSAVSGSLMRWTSSTGPGDDAVMISYKPTTWFGRSPWPSSAPATTRPQSSKSYFLEFLFGLGQSALAAGMTPPRCLVRR